MPNRKPKTINVQSPSDVPSHVSAEAALACAMGSPTYHIAFDDIDVEPGKYRWTSACGEAKGASIPTTLKTAMLMNRFRLCIACCNEWKGLSL